MVVASPPHELDGVDARLHRAFEVEHLNRVGIYRDIFAEVPQVGSVIGEEPRRLFLHNQVGDLELVRGYIDRGMAELDPPLRIGDGVLQKIAEPAHRLGGDDRPLEIESAGHDGPSLAFLAYPVPDGYLHVLEIEDAVLDVAEADKLVDLLNRKALRALLQDEGRKVAVLLYVFRVVAGPRIEHVARCEARSHDEPLLAVKDIDAALELCLGRYVSRVRADDGLRDDDGPYLAVHDARQYLPFLLLRAVAQHLMEAAQHVAAYHPHETRHPAEGLRQDAGPRTPEAEAAVFLRDCRARIVLLAYLPENVPGELPRPARLCVSGQDACREFLYFISKLLLFFRPPFELIHHSLLPYYM